MQLALEREVAADKVWRRCNVHCPPSIRNFRTPRMWGKMLLIRILAPIAVLMREKVEMLSAHTRLRKLATNGAVSALPERWRVEILNCSLCTMVRIISLTVLALHLLVSSDKFRMEDSGISRSSCTKSLPPKAVESELPDSRAMRAHTPGTLLRWRNDLQTNKMKVSTSVRGRYDKISTATFREPLVSTAIKQGWQRVRKGHTSHGNVEVPSLNVPTEVSMSVTWWASARLVAGELVARELDRVEQAAKGGRGC